MLKVYAPAKINLVLEVIDRRDDGYHEICSLVQTINLYDELFIEPKEAITVYLTDPARQLADNLAQKAAEVLRQAAAYGGGATVTIHKKIPIAGGLGGGSSDAAAVLMALNQMWKLNMPIDNLIKLAAALGSDVPLFLKPGTVLVTGRGEKVSLLPISRKLWFVLLAPEIPEMQKKTQRLYSLLGKRHYSNGEKASFALKQWESGGIFDPTYLYNVFDEVAFDAYAGLETYWFRFQQAGASNVHLAGSGPTLFSLVEGENSATEICRTLSEQKFTAYKVATAEAGDISAGQTSS